MGQEEWRSPDRLLGEYEVSDHGNVRRVVFDRRTKSGRNLSHAKNKQGYHYVCLSLSCGQNTGWVHRLVCEAFHGEPPTPKHQAAHRDGDKDNNSSANLYWATQFENMRDRERHGDAPRGTRCGMAKLSDDDVRAIRRMRREGMVQREIGERFGVAPHTVSRIVSGKRWGHLSD